jgi:hypothetical protein
VVHGAVPDVVVLYLPAAQVRHVDPEQYFPAAQVAHASCLPDNAWFDWIISIGVGIGVTASWIGTNSSSSGIVI